MNLTQQSLGNIIQMDRGRFSVRGTDGVSSSEGGGKSRLLKIKPFKLLVMY